MDMNKSSKGQMGLIVNIFIAVFVGVLLAIIVQTMYTASRGNFTGLTLTIADFIMPIFMLLLIIVPVVGVVYLFGRKA